MLPVVAKPVAVAVGNDRLIGQIHGSSDWNGIQVRGGVNFQMRRHLEKADTVECHLGMEW